MWAGRKLFGDGYSGLEYDYRGLLRLYNAKGNTQKAADYSSILHEWNVLRDRIHVQYDGPLQFVTDVHSCDEVVQRFLCIPDRTDTASSPSWWCRCRWQWHLCASWCCDDWWCVSVCLHSTTSCCQLTLCFITSALSRTEKQVVTSHNERVITVCSVYRVYNNSYQS